MTSKLQSIALAVVAIVLALVSFHIGKCNGTVTHPTELKPYAVQGPTAPAPPAIHDTVYKIALAPKRIASMGKAKVEVDSTNISNIDTCADLAPFTATYYDIQNCDTIEAVYEYPSNRFSVWIRSSPDSASVVSKTITVPYPVIVTEYKERSVWIDILSHLGAVVLGYGIGQIK